MELENLDYLITEYESFVIDKNDLLKVLDLTSKITRTNSPAITNNSITFILNWNQELVEMCTTNDLTYFRYKAQLLGRKFKCLTGSISIKVDLLNKLKGYYRDKILIYKKDDNYYIRLIDGDLLINVSRVNTSRLSFTEVKQDCLINLSLHSFGKLLNSYRNMMDDYSDKWISFDGERLSLCGINFYAQTEIKTPVMCLLGNDIDMIIKMYKNYNSDRILSVYSTDNKAKLHLVMDNIEVEILNVISNINLNNINTLSSYIAKPSNIFQVYNMNRIMSLALALPELEKDCNLQLKEDSLLVILKSKKGASEFNLITQKTDDLSEEKEVLINANTLNKIISAFEEELGGIALNKIYTTVCTDKIKVIILNKRK